MAVLALALVGQMAAQHEPKSSGVFRAESVTRTGRFTVNGQPYRVFPLFTPLGEKHWAAGWNPQILTEGSDAREGVVFRTADHGGMVWVLTKYDPANFTISYDAVVPEGFVRRIEVRCRATGNGTEVNVTDIYTGLSEHGNGFVKSLDETAYKKKMAGWEQPIEHYLKTGEAPGSHH